MKTKKSKQLYKLAIKVIPGGVNSPVRSCSAVGTHPLFIKQGYGSHVVDVDGNTFIDYIQSWGALILGHANAQVIAAIKKAATLGTSFGACTENEIKLAKLILESVPSMEMVRLVNSGTEAVMSAVRLARGYTKKDKIIKFNGCYHGHADSMLVKSGSGSLTFGCASSLGVPNAIAQNTLVLPYNNIDTVNTALKKQHKQIAAVIVEPIAANMGVVLPEKNFLFGLRELTRKYNVLLIFDEVITGFRFCFGSAEKLFNIEADIMCLGKIIGGGMPIGAFGAKKEIMSNIAPLGNVYQAGTLSGNPVAVASGLATLKILSGLDYKKIDNKTRLLCGKIEEICQKQKIKYCLNRIGSIFTLFFTDKIVKDLDTAMTSDTKQYAHFYQEMLRQGVILPPSQFEAGFVSFSHTDEDIEDTAEASVEAIEKVKSKK